MQGYRADTHMKRNLVRFRYLFNCLCPTLIEIYNTFKDDIKSALGMDGDGEEEEEEE